MQEENGLENDSRLAALNRRIRTMRILGGVVITAERLAVLTMPAIAVVLVYAILSWFGLFRILPGYIRLGLLLLSGAAFIASLLPIRKIRWPQAKEIESRLEAASGLPHQAISAQSDRPVGDDPFTIALWRQHQLRLARKIRAIDTGAPSPDIARRDPYAIRAVVILLAVVGWTFSLSNSGGRLADAFVYSSPISDAGGVRIDAWVTPPAYTNKAPIYLSDRSGSTDSAIITVPQNSVLSIRVSGGESKVSFIPEGSRAIAELAPNNPDGKSGDEAKADTAKEQGQSYTIKLSKSGSVSIGGRIFAFTVTKDNAPTIRFAKEPAREANGALEIAFEAKDDYGVTAARAMIEPAQTAPSAVPLFELPQFPFDLPGGDARHLRSVAAKDLTEHPLAGKKVRITLVARDAAGAEGKSESKIIVLPSRFFSVPLAGSIAEQRQVFSLDINKIPRALELSDAAAFRAEETIPNKTHFLLLQSTRNRLKLARSVEELEDTATYFWDVARYIEDGDVASAEKRLKDAQKKLSEALSRNASDKEIQQLMKELRQAMKDYLSELAKRMSNDQSPQMSAQMQRMLRAQDLDKMLDQLENLARSGSRDQAKQLLSEMQRMLNNLQTARPRSNSEQAENPMRKQIDKLGELMQKQQKLMEDTFKTEQALRDRMQRGDTPDDGLTQDPFGEMPGAQQEPNDQGQGNQDQAERKPDQGQGDQPQDKKTAEELRKALKEMQARQKALQKDLQDLQKGLKELGMKPIPGMKDAGREMGESSDALGQSQGQRSADAQGRALEALRKGAGDLMQQLRQAGNQNGQGMPVPGGEQADGRDPLGREPGQTGSMDDQVKVPDRIDIQRAREILEEIRKRLGDGPANAIERDYLERLLDFK